MIDKNLKKQNENKNSIKPEVITAAAVVGVGAVVAGVVILNNKQIREKIKIAKINMRKREEDKRNGIENKLVKGKKKVKKITSLIKDSLQHVAKDVKKVIHAN